MAQTGYTPILIYSTTTASQSPAAGNLTNSTLGSELAINITDGKLFYKDNANAVQVIAWKVTPTTAGGTGLTSYTAGDMLYYASGTTLSALAIGATGRYMSSTGSAPQWTAPAALTKTDDTNVTLTLGGSASTALLNAASLTLGWTGTLAVTRGGTGTGVAGIAAFNNITGYTASGATGTTSTNLVFSTSPTLVTPNIGAATGSQLDIDNIRIDGNTISSTDANGNINLLPNGTGITTVGNYFTAGTGSAFTSFSLQSSASGGSDLNWRTGTSARWTLNKGGSETGSNAGSDLTLYRYSDAGSYLGTVMTFNRSTGAVAVIGALSKGSGSFRIPHPLPEKNATHELVHSFIEGPKADLIYRGKVQLNDGKATVNIDQAGGMTEGTFVVLCRDTQCFTSNEEGWHRVRGKVTGNLLSIECEDSTCADTVSWMVIGERQDPHMMETDWTDDNGHVIVEPLKKPQPIPRAQQ